MMKKLFIFLIAPLIFMGCWSVNWPGTVNTNYVKRIKICHLLEDGTYMEMSIEEEEVEDHLAHGDYEIDLDKDGFSAIGACSGSADDCDDNDPYIHPAAFEICGDGIDNNCDGTLNEGCITTLKFPFNDALLGQGCKDKSKTIEWYFDWADFPNATKYNLLVKRNGALYPAINVSVNESHYTYFGKKSLVNNCDPNEWFWKVRVMVNGKWMGWSDVRQFAVNLFES